MNAVLAFVTALTLPAYAWAADVFHSRGQGPLAFALVEHVDECITTTVELLAVDQVLRESGAPSQPDQVIVIDIEQVDTCGEEPVTVLSARGQSDLSTAVFQVAWKLESASLVGTIEVVDSVSGDAFDVFIDIDWIANTPLGRVNEKFIETTSDSVRHRQDRGTFRDADVTGTISAGTTNFLQSATVLIAALNDVTTTVLDVSKNEK